MNHTIGTSQHAENHSALCCIILITKYHKKTK